MIAFTLLLALYSPVLTAASLADRLPLHQKYQVRIVTPLGEEEYSYFVEYAVDLKENQVKVLTSGESYIDNTILDMNLNLIRSEMKVLDSEDITRVGFDSRVAKYEAEKERITLDFYLEQESQATREIYPSNDATEIGIVGLNLQALLAIGRTDFHGNLYDINRGSYFKLSTSLLSKKEITKLASGVRVPQEVKDILSRDDDIHVFMLSYSGLMRIFLPNRFYVVLEKQAPYRILGFWGGSSKLLRYELYDYQEKIH